MLQFSCKDQIYLSVKAIDFRKQINGLIKSVRKIIKEDPLSGAYFVFRNKSKTSLKILQFDGQGFCLFQKRLSTGRFYWPNTKDEVLNMDYSEIQVLLGAGNPEEAMFQKSWKKVC
jgi:transposase